MFVESWKLGEVFEYYFYEGIDPCFDDVIELRQLSCNTFLQAHLATSRRAGQGPLHVTYNFTLHSSDTEENKESADVKSMVRRDRLRDRA